ncbi:MAG TPA: hypothetical protein VKF84_03220 [Candidatus Sulfotelmatobacter sp.]|nr:hypothetical protein [Candidatus Sulfotelmatobacter sp.]
MRRCWRPRFCDHGWRSPLHEQIGRNVELGRALYRLYVPRSLSIDVDYFPPGDVEAALDYFARDHTLLRVGLGIQMFLAYYCGFLEERPSTTMGVFQLALDDARVGVRR